MLASGVFAGVHTLEYAYGRKDPEGKTFGDELKRIGWVGDEKVGARKMHAYFEYHIEQGPILEAEDKQIGVVTHGQGLWWLEFTLTGKAAHTGSTPMKMRVNAGLAMARIFEMVQTVAMDSQPGAVGGVGQVIFSPIRATSSPAPWSSLLISARPTRRNLMACALASRQKRRKSARCSALAALLRRLAISIRLPLTRFWWGACARPPRGSAQPQGHHLRRWPRRLLDGEGGAHHHGHVPLRRWPVAQ